MYAIIPYAFKNMNLKLIRLCVPIPYNIRENIYITMNQIFCYPMLPEILQLRLTYFKEIQQEATQWGKSFGSILNNK